MRHLHAVTIMAPAQTKQLHQQPEQSVKDSEDDEDGRQDQAEEDTESDQTGLCPTCRCASLQRVRHEDQAGEGQDERVE